MDVIGGNGCYVIEITRRSGGSRARWLWCRLEKWEAAKIVDALLDGKKHFWVDHQTIKTRDDRMTLRGQFLEEVIEHRLSRDEKAADIPMPLITDIARARGDKLPAVSQRQHVPERRSKLEATRGDTVTIAAIAAELKLTPRDARAMLRRISYPRPGGSWAWPSDQKDEVLAALERARK